MNSGKLRLGLVAGMFILAVSTVFIGESLKTPTEQEQTPTVNTVMVEPLNAK